MRLAPSLQVSPLTELCVYIWGIGGYVPGIPILAIMVRYNLQSSGVMGSTAAFFWAVVAPWLFTAFFYQAQALLQFCSWVALLCQGFINLVVPILLYRQALLWYPKDTEIASYDALSSKPVGKLPSVEPPLLEGGTQGSSPLSALSGLLQALLGPTAQPDPLKESLLPKDAPGDVDSPRAASQEGQVSLQEGGMPGVCQSPPIVHVKEHTVDHLLSVGAPSALPSQGVLVPAGAPEAVVPEGDVEAVPVWLGLQPVALATFMAWLVTVAVVISIGLSLYN